VLLLLFQNFEGINKNYIFWKIDKTKMSFIIEKSIEHLKELGNLVKTLMRVKFAYNFIFRIFNEK
jgi:hypothetical protein